MSSTCVPITPSLTFLTGCFQTELAINAHVVALGTQKMVSDIHHIVTEERVDSRDQSVSDHPPLPGTKQVLTAA